MRLSCTSVPNRRALAPAGSFLPRRPFPWCLPREATFFSVGARAVSPPGWPAWKRGRSPWPRYLRWSLRPRKENSLSSCQVESRRLLRSLSRRPGRRFLRRVPERLRGRSSWRLSSGALAGGIFSAGPRRRPTGTRRILMTRTGWLVCRGSATARRTLS